ncbi:MBL fold metallo-hydrolase [Maridesulfovibrio sp.]|uniref:MBL fold metallo-hydrolase n=1 Tax=Maridesulfovibrio sp. TaxID=2795000 RepID=UPI002A18B126|nr:MBL fold metallo-hydrolase [Maridesulfovibrio sp.]
MDDAGKINNRIDRKRRRFLKYAVPGVLAGIALPSLSGCLYLQQEKFGRLPEGARLSKIQQSPNYSKGQFHNQVAIKEIVKGGPSVAGFIKYFFHERENPEPPGPMPVVKTDLKSLDRDRDVVIWLGHSSYFVQLGGCTALIDPVFSSYASPFFFSTRAFAGTNIYTADDMPHIDYLLISHDHWDHLDYPTVMALKPKTGKVVTGLGVGEHFARWGFPDDMVHEADWDSSLKLDDSLTVHVLTARHFSGRWLDRNKTLWTSFALETPSRRIFYSGDSGYGPHFKEIGRRFGGFDLVMLDSGQYNENWKYVHMTPESSAQAALDLNAAAALPSHTGKFCLAYHSWDDPFKRFVKASSDKPYRHITPEIGEVVDLADRQQVFANWWETDLG